MEMIWRIWKILSKRKTIMIRLEKKDSREIQLVNYQVRDKSWCLKPEWKNQKKTGKDSCKMKILRRDWWDLGTNWIWGMRKREKRKSNTSNDCLKELNDQIRIGKFNIFCQLEPTVVHAWLFYWAVTTGGTNRSDSFYWSF